MKNTPARNLTLNALVLSFAALALCAATGWAADANPPERMTYQGYLVDSAGNVLGSPNPKNYDVIFRIYNEQTGGTRYWSEQQTVTVDKGYFSVLLGEGALCGESRPALSTVFTNAVNGSDRFIEMTVKGIGPDATDSTLMPRIRFLSSPYAYLARMAINANNASALVNGANAQVLSASGTNLTMAGSITATSLTVGGVAATSVNAGTVSGFGTIPLGGIIMWSGSTVPAGWALCDGSGDTPDLRGRFVLGSGTGPGLSERTLKQFGGEEAHILTVPEMPAHTHKENFTFTGGEDGDNSQNHELYQITAEASAVQSTFSTGGGGAHNTMPPFFVLAFIMRVQ